MSTVPNPGHFPDLPKRDDPVRLVVESPTHIRAYQRSTVDPSGPDKLLAIARAHRDGEWSVTVRGRGDLEYFDNELAARAFMLGLLDDPTHGNSGPGGAL